MRTTWAPAPAILRLRDEVNTAFPRRDKASDGIIGDPSHQARKSSHNPCWSCSGKMHGLVFGIDIDIRPDGRVDRDLATDLLRRLIGDPRVWYVIHNGRIYSRTYGWAARVYKGNPHTEHVHVSLRETPEAVLSTAPWGLLDKAAAPSKPKALPVVSLADARRAARRRGTHPRQTRIIQRALNARLDAKLAVDGDWGPRTRAAWKAWEQRLAARNPGRVVNTVPDDRSLARLGRDRFRAAA